ncbi:MAG: universal stress protein A [Pseudohongiella sp.]|nr:MAG: universal stress protein A [Pseudohongiella sp.]
MYDKVLVAVDLSPNAEKVILAAKKLVNNELDRLQIVHTVEPLPAMWSLEGCSIDPVELQQKIVENATEVLEKMTAEAGIDKSRQCIKLGSSVSEIRNAANEFNADAIVIGGHGHSGWKLMLGNTANKLLHGATCDVLTVYVGKD